MSSKHGGKRRGSGRKHSDRSDRRARLVHLYETENTATDGKPRRKPVIERVSQAVGDPHETVRSSTRSRDKQWTQGVVSVIADPAIAATMPADATVESRKDFPGVMSTVAVPGWSLPDPLPTCHCDADPFPHWHCAHCQVLLGAGIPSMGLIDAHGDFETPTLACTEACRLKALEEQ